MGSTFLAVLLQVVVAARNNSSCGSCGGPVFGMIKQTPCGGSTWFLDLLDADPCSLGFRHGGRHRDGAYRGVPSGLKDLYPSRRAPPPGAPASQGVSFMSGDGLGPNPTYLATHALPRGVRGVAITHFRDPLFVAECELKKKAFQELHQRTVKAHPNAWRNCDGNHLTPETCPFSVNFTYTINAQELFDMWTKVKRDQRGGHSDASMVARSWNTTVLEVHYADLVCAHKLPPKVRAALGLAHECPEDGRRLRATTKTSSPNSFADVRNRDAIATFFATKGFLEAADAVRQTAEVNCNGTKARFEAPQPSQSQNKQSNIVALVPNARPWCCVRYVHIGKAAGTSFDRWVKDRKVQDAQTFHHPVTWFLDVGAMLAPRCILGVTLRSPVAHLWSRFNHCLGGKCVRRHVDYACGFIACVKDSPLQKRYEVKNAKQPAERDALIKLMADHPEQWHLGRNLQTRMLGQVSHTEKGWDVPKSHRGFSSTYIDWNEDLFNSTESKGREYLARAKLRLLFFDFVLVVEDLDHGYQSQLGEPGGAPHENIGVVGKAGNSSRFPPEHEDRMKYLLQLDRELYAFGADISRQLSLRGPLAQFAVEAKQKKKSCLELARNSSKHPLLAFDRNGVFDDTATTGSPLPPGVSSSLDWAAAERASHNKA